MKFRPVGAELFHEECSDRRADGRTDRQMWLS